MIGIASEKDVVTAIITTHNRSKLCLKAINSVINQTYKDIEIIVVDDASDEAHSLTLKNSIVNLGVQYIYIGKEESHGGNYARNVGIKKSKGEYIAFLDDDDEWFPDKITKQIAYIVKNPNVSVVACGKEVEFDYSNREGEKVSLLLEGDMRDRIWYNIPYTTSTLFLKKNVLDKIGLFDENLKYWQEYELLIRLSQIGDFGVVRENLVLYRINKADKNRLTNKLDGWEETVKYIDNKHSKLLSEQSQEVKNKRKMLIIQDGINRSINMNSMSKKRYYLFKKFLLYPCWQNFVKILLGVQRFSDIK